MNSVSAEILLITAIFITGLSLCYAINIVSGLGFIILANIALPTVIKFARSTMLQTSRP